MVEGIPQIGEADKSQHELLACGDPYPAKITVLGACHVCIGFARVGAEKEQI